MKQPPISALSFFGMLKWIDGSALVVEAYRQQIFSKALDERREDGVPQITFVLAGRGKKNFKSLDLVLAAIYVLLFRDDPRGSDALIVANDEDQAGADLDLARKLIAANPELFEDELVCFKDEIRRKDGKGIMRVLPANNALGQHGKTAAFLGFDEIHGYKDHNLFEALAPDPTRFCLTWVTSYDSVFDDEGCPLHDFKKIGQDGTDDRMLFTWYSGDYCTDPAFANRPQEERANPSMASWPEGKGYLDQQRRRLPSAKYRRLHLNLPGAPQGAFFDQGVVERAIVAGCQEISPQDGVDYLAFVDMSGGSNDDATLAVAHWDGQKAVLDLLINQGVAVPFNPRLAVARFVVYCRKYRCREVHGDAYAGETFRRDFSDMNVDYIVEKQSRTDWYESLEIGLNADQVELLDLAKLRSELMTIVRRGAVLDHMSGRHDDWPNSAAGALTLVNPDLGNPEPGILTFYQRQAEAAAASTAAPTLHAEHGREAIMQLGQKRPAGFVRVLVPGEPSHLYGMSGTAYVAEIEDGSRVCWMSPDDAYAAISSALSLEFFELNADLRKTLGGVKPPPAPGIRVADMLQAIEDSRPVNFTNKGGITRQSLAMLRRAR
jgi:hypothetical protein